MWKLLLKIENEDFVLQTLDGADLQSVPFFTQSTVANPRQRNLKYLKKLYYS